MGGPVSTAKSWFGIAGLVLLCVGSSVMARNRGTDGGIPPLDVAMGRVATLSFLEDTEWRKLSKLEILFLFQETNQVLSPCVLYEVGLESTRTQKPGEQNPCGEYEPQSTTRLGNPVKKSGGAMGVKLGVVPPDYSGDGDNLLVFGKAYRIWSREYGCSAVFQMPHIPEKRQDLRLVWVVNRRGGAESRTSPPHIQGTIVGDTPEAQDEFVVRYANPTTRHDQMAMIQGQAFGLTVTEMEGELVVGPMSGEGLAWLYMSKVRNRVLQLPRDADRVFSLDKTVPCTVRVTGPRARVRNVTALAVFVAQKDVLPIHGRKLAAGTPERVTFDQSHSVQLDLCPGEYWLRVYGGNDGTSVLGESAIRVQNVQKGNLLTISVGSE